MHSQPKALAEDDLVRAGPRVQRLVGGLQPPLSRHACNLRGDDLRATTFGAVLGAALRPETVQHEAGMQPPPATRLECGDTCVERFQLLPEPPVLGDDRLENLVHLAQNASAATTAMRVV